jgi:hypothetical protein
MMLDNKAYELYILAHIPRSSLWCSYTKTHARVIIYMIPGRHPLGRVDLRSRQSICHMSQKGPMPPVPVERVRAYKDHDVHPDHH